MGSDASPEIPRPTPETDTRAVDALPCALFVRPFSQEALRSKQLETAKQKEAAELLLMEMGERRGEIEVRTGVADRERTKVTPLPDGSASGQRQGDGGATHAGRAG